jgi:RNA polymerase sigma factor (sigma-70 family)
MGISEYNKTVDEFSESIFRFILKNVTDDEISRDIVQEAYMRLWNKRKEIPYEKSKTYLFTTAYHLLIDFVRKEKSKQKYLNELNIETSSENNFSDLSEIIEEAVTQLPEIQRTVILLRDYEGYSYKEIGDITNLSESQVKVYIYRARTVLKRYIGSLDTVL